MGQVQPGLQFERRDVPVRAGIQKPDQVRDVLLAEGDFALEILRSRIRHAEGVVKHCTLLQGDQCHGVVLDAVAHLPPVLLDDRPRRGI